MKLRDSNYNSYENTLAICDKLKMMSDLNMSHGKMSDFVLIPFFGLNFSIKLRNFDFESHCNTSFLIKEILHQV